MRKISLTSTYFNLKINEKKVNFVKKETVMISARKLTFG
jgi:hypothetical protein